MTSDADTTELEPPHLDPERIRDADDQLSSAWLQRLRQRLGDGDKLALEELTAPLHAADMGDVIEALSSDERLKLVTLLGDKFDFSSLTEVDESVRTDLIEELPAADVARGVAELDNDDAVFILEDIGIPEREDILAQMPAFERLSLKRSLDYPNDSAGRLMQTDFIAIPPYWTVGQTIDFQRPTVIFAGESIMFGYGLEWPDTMAAQFERMTGIGAANIAVNAHATDQTLLRLRQELPRFGHPLAVVIPFVPVIFDRNLDRDRPYLDATLHWHPGDPPPLRIVEIARRALRYRSTRSIREGVAMTQAALREAMALARARGAEPLVLVPQHRPEKPRETAVRRMVLDAGHIPYLLVWLPHDWRNPIDSHPDPRGARALAAAIAKALEERQGFKGRASERN